MKIFTSKDEINSFLSALKKESKTIGFVPTMGALHEGHLSLVNKAKEKNDFVNVDSVIRTARLDF